jgi:hypothetical protein
MLMTIAASSAETFANVITFAVVVMVVATFIEHMR